MAAMRSFPFLCAALLALAGAGPVAAAPTDAQRQSIAAVQALLQHRPDDPTLWFFLARFEAQAGDVHASVAALEKVDALGEGFLPARELGFEADWGDPAFQAVRARMEARLPRLDFAPIAFEIDDAHFEPEGIAWDSHGHNFFLGSIAEHRILRVDAHGAQGEFAGAAANLDAVLGLAVDAPRRTLYAVSTSAVTPEGRVHRHNAIVAFDVDSARLLRRIEVPEALQLNDVAVARGGRVFATDSESGAVFEIPKQGAPRILVPAGSLRGSNGLAASADAKRLYVAQSSGIAVVDLATGAVSRMTMPAREAAGAIDGLYQWEGSLIGVQNLTNPGRVILMTLDHDGTAVTRVQTLLSHHHNMLAEPTTGAVTDHGFFLLAATRGKPIVLRIPLP